MTVEFKTPLAHPGGKAVIEISQASLQLTVHMNYTSRIVTEKITHDDQICKIMEMKKLRCGRN